MKITAKRLKLKRQVQIITTSIQWCPLLLCLIWANLIQIWSWNSNTFATWYEELTHLKRPWSWERLKAGGEGDNRGWDGWVASPTQCTWVWVNSGSWWWTGRPGREQFMGSQRVGHNWVTELNPDFRRMAKTIRPFHSPVQLLGSLDVSGNPTQETSKGQLFPTPFS